MAKDLTVILEDRPGTLAAACEALGNAGVNIDLVYLATRTRVVIGADDLAKASAAVG